MIPVSKKYARSDPGSNGNVEPASSHACAAQVPRGARCGLEIRGLTRDRVQVHERAHRIAGNLV